MKKFKTIQSDLLKYNNMKCEILGELDKAEYDKEEVGTMYNIRLENGVEIQAFEDELKEVEEGNELRRSYYVTQIVRMRADFEQEEIEKEDLNEDDWSMEEIIEEYNRLAALDNTYEENYM